MKRDREEKKSHYVYNYVKWLCVLVCVCVRFAFGASETVPMRFQQIYVHLCDCKSSVCGECRSRHDTFGFEKKREKKTRTNRSRYSIRRIFNTYRSSTSFLFHHITVDWTIVFNIFLLLFIFFLPSSCVLLLASMQAIAITSCCFNFTCFFLHFSQSHSLPLPVPHARLISFSQK